jgi:hypothetical protein
MSSPELETQIKVLDEHDMSELPSAGHLTTVVVPGRRNSEQPRCSTTTTAGGPSASVS